MVKYMGAYAVKTTQAQNHQVNYTLFDRTKGRQLPAMVQYPFLCWNADIYLTRCDVYRSVDVAGGSLA